MASALSRTMAMFRLSRPLLAVVQCPTEASLATQAVRGVVSVGYFFFLAPVVRNLKAEAGGFVRLKIINEKHD